MNTVLFWFRHDLRLHDQSALHAACQLGAQQLLPVVCLPDVQATTAWGFARIGPHRRATRLLNQRPQRPRDLDLGYMPFMRGMGIAQYLTDPVFRRELDLPLSTPAFAKRPASSRG